MRGDQRGFLSIKAIAFALILLVAFAGVLAAFTVALPDANPPTESSVGYFDTKATVVWGQFTGCNLTNGQGCEVSPYAAGAAYNPKVVFDEHLAVATSPASFFELPGATIGTSCSSYGLITVLGEGLNDFDPTPKESDHVTFTLGTAVTYRWGHFHLNQEGRYDVTIELYVQGCYAYGTQAEKVETLYKTLEFDGVRDA